MAKLVFGKKIESAEIVNFNKVGDTYTGVLVECKEVERQGEKGGKETAFLYQFHMVNSDGEPQTEKLYGFWASELLTDLMKAVNPGEIFRVTYKAQKAPGQKGYSPTKLYSVEIAEIGE